MATLDAVDLLAIAAVIRAEVAVLKIDIDKILADTGTDGVRLARQAITALSFDNETAYPQTGPDVSPMVLP